MEVRSGYFSWATKNFFLLPSLTRLPSGGDFYCSHELRQCVWMLVVTDFAAYSSSHGQQTDVAVPKRVAIIGGGISGWSCAKKLKCNYPSTEVVVFDTGKRATRRRVRRVNGKATSTLEVWALTNRSLYSSTLTFSFSLSLQLALQQSSPL